jgi:hypothetical protein
VKVLANIATHSQVKEDLIAARFLQLMACELIYKTLQFCENTKNDSKSSNGQPETVNFYKELLNSSSHESSS